MEVYKIDQLKNLIQSAHVNFLIGSGLSRPYLSTLGPIENLLTEVQLLKDSVAKTIVEVSLLAEYFSSVMAPCAKIGNLSKKEASNLKVVLDGYSNFLSLWNSIIARRSSSLLDKTINIFTTNIDNILELVAEGAKLEFNDGFRGHYNPVFHEDSFSNVVSKVSPHYQNTSKIPVFNYLKIHGSINWNKCASDETAITYDRELELIAEIEDALQSIPQEVLLPLEEFKSDDYSQWLTILKEKAEAVLKNKSKDELECLEEALESFRKAYFRLVMIHPRKAKFRESVLDMHFYELMRIYSNTLEKSGSVLFVMGFSFADEHLAQLTIRAANSNPTLHVIVFAFDEVGKADIKSNIAKGGMNYNNNICIISPSDFYRVQYEGLRDRLNNNGFVITSGKVDVEKANHPDNNLEVDNSAQIKTSPETASDIVDEKESADNAEHTVNPETVFSLDNINTYVFANLGRLIF